VLSDKREFSTWTTAASVSRYAVDSGVLRRMIIYVCTLRVGVRDVKQNRERDEKHTLLEWKIDFLIFASVD